MAQCVSKGKSEVSSLSAKYSTQMRLKLPQFLQNYSQLALFPSRVNLIFNYKRAASIFHSGGLTAMLGAAILRPLILIYNPNVKQYLFYFSAVGGCLEDRGSAIIATCLGASSTNSIIPTLHDPLHLSGFFYFYPLAILQLFDFCCNHNFIYTSYL